MPYQHNQQTVRLKLPTYGNITLHKSLACHTKTIIDFLRAEMFFSFAFRASVFSIPAIILHLQVPQIPPPHLKGMPPRSRIETRNKLLFSSACALKSLFEENVISTMLNPYQFSTAYSALISSASMDPKLVKLSNSAYASSTVSNFSI